MERLGHPQVSLCLQRPSWGLKGRVSAFAQNLHGQGASDFKPSICFHGNMLASPRSSSVSFLDSSCAHAGTCTHPECRHTPTPTGIPNSTASSLGTTLLGHKDVLYLHVQSHWVPFRKKKRPWLRPRRGQSRDMPIPCSLKELLECGPDSVMKTVTVSWMPSKLPPLTASLLISGCAKCLLCSFSFSSCSSPLRKAQDCSHSQCSDGKVEAQRGRVTHPRLQLLNGRAGTNSDLLDSGACSPTALGTSRKTPQHREVLINSYWASGDCSPNPAITFLSSWTGCFRLVSVPKTLVGGGAPSLPKAQGSGLQPPCQTMSTWNLKLWPYLGIGSLRMELVKMRSS